MPISTACRCSSTAPACACDFTLADLAGLCDVFYIGGTKVGALCGEAVVFTKKAPKHFFTTIKQHGALLAKGRLLGVQFDTLFTDNLYGRIAANAIDRAQDMIAVLKEKGIPFFLETPTNQQFVILENAYMEALSSKVGFDIWEPYDATHTVVRFATSWATTEEKIQQPLKIFANSEKIPIFAIPNDGAVAQMVEQWTENPCVGSSILPSTT